jgi:hypothetical protein
MTRRVNKTWKIKSEVPNKKYNENISPEIDEVNNRRSVGETSEVKDEEYSDAHNSDFDVESPTIEQQEQLSDDYLKNISITF